MEPNHRPVGYPSECWKPMKVERDGAPARRTPARVPSTYEVRIRAGLSQAPR